MKKLLQGAQLFLLLFFLGGCLAPDRQSEDPTILKEHLATVQRAVDQYQQQFGTLPVQGGQGDSKKEKMIHFVALKEFLGEVPSSAFEQGGYFHYVLIGSDLDPVVKILDLRVSKVIGEVQQQVDAYQQKYKAWPLGESLGEKVYAIDFSRLGSEPVTIPSPYTLGMSLPLIITDTGKVYVDYRSDVMRKMQEEGVPEEGEDLFRWLVGESPFAPAHGYPLQVKEGEPVFKGF